MVSKIGYAALLGGIVLSILSGIINLPIKGTYLGFLMIGGAICLGIGRLLKK